METDTSNDAMQTPVMRQYFAAKQAHPDCLMFCRIGDFYELFYDDAILVARELQLTLTARDKEKKQPMCGVPYHAAEVYLQRLLRKGYRIALCEQMEDPKTVKGIVKREVTRVLTPGTSIDPGLAPGESNWLAALTVLKSGTAGLAMVDLSTGELRATEFGGPHAWALATDELGRVRPAELLYAPGGLALGTQPTLNGQSPEDSALDAIRTKTAVDDYVFTADYALPLLQQHFKVHSLDGLGVGAHEAAAIAAGAILHYLRAILRAFGQPGAGCGERAEPRAGGASVLGRIGADYASIYTRRLLHADGQAPAAIYVAEAVARSGRD